MSLGTSIRVLKERGTMQNVPNGVEMWLQVAGETFPNGPQKPDRGAIRFKHDFGTSLCPNGFAIFVA